MNGYVPAAGAVLGKAPHAAEFLRAHGGDALLAAFDGWMVERFEWALGRQGPDFQAAFTQAPLVAFAFRPQGRSDQLIAGVFGPSEDSGGRRYPLIAAASAELAPALLEEPELAPLVFEALWARGGEIYGAVRSGSVGDLAETARGMRVEGGLSLEEGRAIYRGWAHELRLAELWPLLGLEAAQAARGLRLLGAAVEPFRGVECPDTRLALRVPLGQAGGAGLCFWIDLLRRSLGWRGTMPSFFWSDDGARGSALLCLGEPPRPVLAELALPSDRHDEVCDVAIALPEAAVEALSPLAPGVREVMEQPAATLETLLARVAMTELGTPAP